jgi:O-methyltransferase
MMRARTGAVQQRFSLLGRVARWWLGRRHATIVHMIFPEARRDLELIERTRREVPILLQDAAALEILAHVRAARRPGHAMAEAGVFAGGTARLICEAKGDAPLYLFDVFDALGNGPAPSARETAAELEKLFGGVHVARDKVAATLRGYAGVHIRAGFFPDSARGLEELRFSFVHLDFDLEASTREALNFFHPRLCRGGIIVGDDYNLPGVRRAFDEFFATRADPLIALPWGQVVAVRTG